jgi:uncharacterized protein involved in type VI secretion and phage assembly
MARINGVVRGTIANAMDPTGSGRVFVQLPAVAGAAGTWAPVCRAFGAPAPASAAVGRAVWVAFENGDPSFPVVLGLAN